MVKARRSMLIAMVAIMLICAGALQRGFIYRAWERNYSPNQTDIPTGLSPDQLLVALSGFRELIAGILWVKADSFFDTGNYDAILPMIRLVTWLDPRQIDVYATGMWHIGYNFTDEDQRSDRRYIPAALALGKEGAAKNDKTYELFYETGWLWYHKIDDDYENAVKWFQEAHKREDINLIPARKNLLNMAFQRNGQVWEAYELLQKLYADAEKRFAEDEAFGNRQNRDVIENNMDTMLVRMAQRGEFARRNNTFDRNDPYDVNPPFDVGFSAQVTVTRDRELKIVGTWNVQPVGTRVRVVLRDADYSLGRPGGMIWDSSDTVDLDPPRDVTFMQDQLFVKNRRFEKRIDMSKDPTMYPFESPEYIIDFYYNPRSAPPHIQDKFGWSGEGMTDSNFLNTEVRPGQRVVYAQLKLTRDQILRRGEWRDKVPVVQTPNYVPPTRLSGVQGDIIQVPNMLTEQVQGGG
ncbi:MAG: hypothetical protein ACK4XJ_03600 [Fimbriimonadaceae bacterium]